MSRVLICLSDGRAERQLADELAARHECSTIPPDRALPSEGFDLCIVDATEHGRRPELARRGGDLRDGMPPLLLVVSREDAEDGASRLAHVDDFVVAPLDPIELSARVDRLLAVRRERVTPPEVRALEVALAKSEARLADAEALAHAGHFELDPRTGAASWSQELSRLVGRDLREGPLSYDAFLGMVDPEDRPRWEAACRDTSAGGRTVELRMTIAGEVRTFVGRIHDRADGAETRQGTIVDITEQRRSELQEALANEMTGLVVHGSPASEFIARGAANWIRLFPESITAVLLDAPGAHAWREAQISGLPDDMQHLFEPLKAVERLSPPSPRQRAPVVFADLEEDPRCRPYLDAFRAHGLRACWFLPIVSSQQALIGSFAVCSRRAGAPRPREVTIAGRAARLVGIVIERSQTMETLRESESRLRVLFDHSPVGMSLNALDGRAVYESRAFFGLLGRPSSDAPTGDWIDFVVPEDQPRAREAWRALLEHRTTSADLVCRFESAAREMRTARVLANAIRDGGDTRGFVVTLEDISERVRLEEDLRQAQKMEAVGRLARGIAHDFNNLLTVISSGVSVLERTDALAQNEVLRQMGAAGERAAVLTHQLMAFSRRQAMEPRTLDLRALVTNVCSLLRCLVGSQIVLETDLGPLEAPVRVDANMIEQVLMNLVINARDAMLQGGRIVLRIDTLITEQHATAEGIRPGGVFTRLSVSDTGAGIDPAALPHVFEPFYTTKEEGKGTGLGLAIVYGIAQQHGGWVEVESEPGRGATFHVYLPRAPVPASVEVAPPATSAGTILLVEDDAAVRQMIRRSLEGCGYTIREADTGDAALETWRAQHDQIDSLVTEINIPGSLPGSQLAERLRLERPALPVVYMTGFSRHDAKAEPPVIFVRKPFSLSTLAAAVSTTLERGRANEAT